MNNANGDKNRNCCAEAPVVGVAGHQVEVVGDLQSRPKVMVRREVSRRDGRRGAPATLGIPGGSRHKQHGKSADLLTIQHEI